jgi:hypothetical protein
LIVVKSIFFESGYIENTKIGVDRRPSVRKRLTLKKKKKLSPKFATSSE